jgi:hypothetical protein
MTKAELEEVRHLLADLFQTRILDITDEAVVNFVHLVERRGMVLAFPVRAR